jgi:hypothetical protein
MLECADITLKERILGEGVTGETSNSFANCHWRVFGGESLYRVNDFYGHGTGVRIGGIRAPMCRRCCLLWFKRSGTLPVSFFVLLLL